MKKIDGIKYMMVGVVGLFLLSLVGCGMEKIEEMEEFLLDETAKPTLQMVREAEGTIGETIAVTRVQAAKMVAMALYTKNELLQLEGVEKFSDITKEEWAYPYVNGCAVHGIFVEGTEFLPDTPLLLWEAKEILEILSPTFTHGIELTDENEEMAISYALWVELFRAAVAEIGGADIEMKQEIVLYAKDAEIGLTHGIVDGAGYDFTTYVHTEIHFLQKNNEILGLISVEDGTPILESVYYRTVENGLEVITDITYILPYDAEEIEGVGHITLGENEIAIEAGTVYEKDFIRRVTGNEISLKAGGILQLHEQISIYDSDLFLKEEADFIVGSAVTDFYVLDGEVIGAVERERAMPYQIRVLLGGGGHDLVAISGTEELTIATATQSETVSVEMTLTAESSYCEEGVVTISSGDTIFISFGGGEKRMYENAVEVEVLDGKLMVVQTLPMEEYLVGVVPYEMPSTFGAAALEAQAICARSYAYNQFYASPYGHFGANVVDTSANQVFKGSETTEEATAAVKVTEGQCLVMGDRVVQTYFYSTSSGFGAKDVEVWSGDGSFSATGKPYLVGGVYGVDAETPKTEADWLAFWQDYDISAYDEDSPWYRWKIYFTLEQFDEIVKETLPTIAKSKVKIFDLEGNPLDDLPDDLGVLKNVEVTARGESGVVEKMEFRFSNVVVEVATENALRSVISPVKSTTGETIYLQRGDGENIEGQTMLPSGFFSVKEQKYEAGSVKAISIYGGGFGHGVGLSQYGAKALAKEGASAEEILQTYFYGVRVEKVM